MRKSDSLKVYLHFLLFCNVNYFLIGSSADYHMSQSKDSHASMLQLHSCLLLVRLVASLAGTILFSYRQYCLSFFAKNDCSVAQTGI